MHISYWMDVYVTLWMIKKAMFDYASNISCPSKSDIQQIISRLHKTTITQQGDKIRSIYLDLLLIGPDIQIVILSKLHLGLCMEDVITCFPTLYLMNLLHMSNTSTCGTEICTFYSTDFSRTTIGKYHSYTRVANFFNCNRWGRRLNRSVSCQFGFI